MSFTRKLYVSDTHFGHEAIIGHCGRPFTSVKEMDGFMINAWNSVVRDGDLVYHLGDFAIADPEHAKRVFHQLRGRKVLILGNHDTRRGPQDVYQHILDLPWDQPPLESLEVKDEGCRLFLSHYAHRTWQGSHRENSYHFYGHSHAKIPHLGRSRDVGVDCEDVAFTPRTFKELTACLPGLETAISHA
jgi:calcineurin-like phosphoesterase family protein